MSELSRKDIWQTVIQAISAFSLALGVMAAGIVYFFWLVEQVQAQQKSLEELQWQIQQMLTTQEQMLIAQERRGEQLDALLEWVLEQKEKEEQGEGSIP